MGCRPKPLLVKDLGFSDCEPPLVAVSPCYTGNTGRMVTNWLHAGRSRSLFDLKANLNYASCLEIHERGCNSWSGIR
jgi:hypothetical protein